MCFPPGFWPRTGGPANRRIAEIIARPPPKKDNSNGGGTCSKSSRHLSQSRSQKQNPAHDLSRERGKIAGRGDVVRQFLRIVAPGWALATRLQARDLHGDAGPSDP